MSLSLPSVWLSPPVISRLLGAPVILDNEVWWTIANTIPTPIYLLGGIILGIIGLSFSSQALRLIKEDNLENKNRMVAIAGRLLGILGIIINIFSIPVFLMQ